MCPDALRCAFALLMLLDATAAAAQERTSPAAGPPPVAASPAAGDLTGKERLGKKWTDEQLIDNCKVPPALRGSKPRPDKCSGPPA